MSDTSLKIWEDCEGSGRREGTDMNLSYGFGRNHEVDRSKLRQYT